MEDKRLHRSVYPTINSYRKKKMTSDGNASKKSIESSPFSKLVWYKVSNMGDIQSSPNVEAMELQVNECKIY